MKTQTKLWTAVAGVLLLATVIVAQDQATRDFITAVNNMVGPDVSASHLLETINKSGSWGSRDVLASDLQSLLNIYSELKFPQIGNIVIPTLKIYPYARLRPLNFCTTCKVTSLTFYNSISPTSNTVWASGMIAVKANGKLSVRQATGFSSSTAKKQYAITVVKKCDQPLIGPKKCKDENVYTERGFYPNELDLVTTKLQREAVLGMKQEIYSKTGMQSVFQPDTLTSSYLDEGRRMRNLYPQIEYDHSELDMVPDTQLTGAISAASLGNIADSGVLNRILVVAKSSPRSTFIVVPNASHFYVAAVNKLTNGNFRLRLSTFRVQGKLPTGALVTSTGSWSTERVGEGSVPSLSQIIAIFPALKD